MRMFGQENNMDYKESGIPLIVIIIWILVAVIPLRCSKIKPQASNMVVQKTEQKNRMSEQAAPMYPKPASRSENEKYL